VAAESEDWYVTEPSLLYSREVPITDKIHIVIPTVGEIIDHEDEYYTLVSMLTAMPIDFMVQLDDLGIDFDEINEYELFLLLFPTIKKMDVSLIFGDLDLTKFDWAKHIESDMHVVYDEENDIVIDRVTHTRIADTLRKLHHLEKDTRKPGNKEAREYMIERARKKLQRRKKKKNKSQLGQLIVAMVNTEQYKYGYESTRDLTIYQFNESVQQIMHKVEYDNMMHGIYSGTVDPKSISQDNFNWLDHK